MQKMAAEKGEESTGVRVTSGVHEAVKQEADVRAREQNDLSTSRLGAPMANLPEAMETHNQFPKSDPDVLRKQIEILNEELRWVREELREAWAAHGLPTTAEPDSTDDSMIQKPARSSVLREESMNPGAEEDPCTKEGVREDVPEGPDVELGKTKNLVESGDFLPRLDVEIKGRTFAFLVDTGVDVHVIDASIVRDLNLLHTRIVNPVIVRFIQGSQKWLRDAGACINVKEGIVLVNDRFGVDHECKLCTEAVSPSITQNAFRFQSVQEAFQVCTAHQFSGSLKMVDEACVSVVGKGRNDMEEEDRIAAMPLHPNMQALVDRYAHIMPDGPTQLNSLKDYCPSACWTTKSN
ncbi:hypothetical protein R1flu_000091 [Riccia fluitans]|uniref:Peptidase A2 domain-containing protein n=1 Tax=Riccia fluitans TaxID=41844 RepID=A0ABD1XZG0_9MARC